jgi:hypothetical protein
MEGSRKTKTNGLLWMSWVIYLIYSLTFSLASVFDTIVKNNRKELISKLFTRCSVEYFLDQSVGDFDGFAGVYFIQA